MGGDQTPEQSPGEEDSSPHVGGGPHPGAVLVAPPGAGKTTLVPLSLLQAPWMGGRKLLLLEPRRLAARAAAWRMASLLGEREVGGTVGYRIRLDTRVGRRTRIEVVTEGVLTRLLQDDPALEGVGAILFDEFHERSLHADLGLALALEARELLRPDLRLLVMSATLEAEPVARLLGGEGAPAPVLESEGRSYPVTTRWRDRPLGDRWIEPAVADTVLDALETEARGDVLVFLPGAAEIHRTARRLEEALASGADALPGDLGQVDLHILHGSLPREAQEAAMAPAPPGRRKVILASAVAESSLTFEGVRIVVDGGLMRVPRFDARSGLTRLETVRVSRDAADQRRGRAGRTEPGVCYRLWTEGEERGLVPTRTPELLEADLAPLLLELARWGSDPGDLRWIDPPPEGAVAVAAELLRTLGVVTAEGRLTPHGEAVAALGAHPRIGHLLVVARERGLVGAACDLVAVLADRDPIRAPGRRPDPDLRLRTEALARGPGARVPPAGHEVDRGALARARQEAAHWRRRVGGGDAATPPEPGDLALLAALAWPDRVGRHRGEGRYLLSGGRGVALPREASLLGAPWIVAVGVEGRGREGEVTLALPLDEATLQTLLAGPSEGGLAVVEEDEVRWDPEGERVEALRIRRLGAIEVERGRLHDPAPEAVWAALAAGIRGVGLEAALPWSRETRQLRERLAFLHARREEPFERAPGAPAGAGAEAGPNPTPTWPPVSDEALLADLEGWLLPFAPGARSLADLARVDLAEALLSRVPWEARSTLDRLAPTHLAVPSGSRITLDYGDPEAPVLAARIQELFGMTETPRIAGGSVPLLVHLLSPARRPVQVTRDLASFWREGYFEVRKDLRGRYPRHFWPDDPLSAPATRRVRPGP